MLRHRVIAAAPVRSATATWDTIVGLVVNTLDRSSGIRGGAVAEALASARPAGLMLIAGGHLERHAITLIADPVHVEITTVSGLEALSHNEDLGPIPGGASASSWVVHFPTPDPIGPAIAAALDGLDNVTVAKAALAEPKTATSARPLVDLAAVELLAKEKRR